jgi:hypothetical protein
MMREGYDTRSFKPAYVKPKHDIDINQQFKRRAGETPVLGTLTPQQRYDATIAENFRKEREMIERRINWMASQALINSAVVVEGEDYPRVTINYGRDAGLTEVLAGTARWGESAATPLADIEEKNRLARKLSGGRITDLIMGEEAYSRFYSNADVRALLSNQARIGGTWADHALFSTAETDKDAEFKAAFVGNRGGEALRIWTYAGYYHERNPDTGAKVERMYLDPNAVIGIGNKLGGVQCLVPSRTPTPTCRLCACSRASWTRRRWTPPRSSPSPSPRRCRS